MTERQITDSDLLAIDLFAGDKDDAGAKCVSSRIVTTRKPQTCMFSEEFHDIPVGTRARFEKALIDDCWSSFYACCACIEGWIQEEGLF